MNTQIYQEATDWLIRHREGELSPQEKDRFDAWLRESPQHVRAYLEMSALWEDAPALEPNWNPAPEQLIARARSEGNVHALADRGRPGKGEDVSAPLPAGGRLRAGLFAVAATFLVTVAGATSWYWLHRNVYATDIGEQRSIVLADGSTVELNSRSRVRIRYNDAQRDVDLLEGQALFRVAHNAARPFIVHSGTAHVRAVGTQFDVYRKRAGTVVTVVEGKVAASKSGDGNAILLVAGEQLTVPVGKPSGAGQAIAAGNPQPANVTAATAWIQRTLVFESAPLSNVAEEFNRYNTRQLVVTDPELAGIHISGVFSSTDPALLLKFLRAQSELNVDETDTEIRVGKKRG